jgi:hypothetical protein
MSAETDLVSGDGSLADFTNLFGGNVEANQSAFDAADNGSAVQNGNGTATQTAPSWLGSLTGLLTTGAKLASTGITVANELNGKTTAPASTSATPSKQASNGSAATTSMSKTFLIIGAAVVGLLVLMLALRK